MPRVLGIDPGLRLTGYGCVHVEPGSLQPTLIEAGVLKLDPKLDLDYRLEQLHADLTDLLVEIEPDIVCVEKLYAHYKHPRTAILMGHARGVILLAVKQRRLPVIHLPSTEVKKAFTGHGHASKEQIQRAVQHQFDLPDPPSPPDVADAIAIATTHARRVGLGEGG